MVQDKNRMQYYSILQSEQRFKHLKSEQAPLQEALQRPEEALYLVERILTEKGAEDFSFQA